MVQEANAARDEESVESKRPRDVKPRKTKVTVYERLGPNVIVKAGSRYVLLPKETIVDGKVLSGDLDAAPDYGIEWEKHLPDKGGKELAEMLRVNGIWTTDDMRARWPLAKRARVGICNVEMAEVLKQAEQKE